jgi:hypothetical protein
MLRSVSCFGVLTVRESVFIALLLEIENLKIVWFYIFPVDVSEIEEILQLLIVSFIISFFFNLFQLVLRVPE